MGNAQTDASVKAALARADTRRGAMFDAAKDRFEKSALASGSFSVGRTEDGKPYDTRTPLSLGITISGWYVRTVFKRDDAGKLAGKDWRDVEADAKAGGIPTRLVVTENHIITAVRELKHVREGYLAEIESTKELVSRIIALNQSVVNKPHPVSDADISAVISGLKEIRPEIESKDSPLKQIVSLGRLDEAVRRFESVLSPQCKNRALELGRACAVLTSVPERLTAWRDRRIAGGVAYTTMREASLRVERDKWVFSQLARYSSSINKIRQFADEDERKKEVLGRVRGMLDEMDSIAVRLRRLRKAARWSPSDEAALGEKKKLLGGMETEASASPWADSGKKAELRKAISRIARKKSPAAEDAAELESARSALQEMRSAAMKLPYYDKSVIGPLRREIRQLEGRKKRSEGNAAKLDAAEKEFAAKKTEAMRCLWANAEMFGAKVKEPGAKQARLAGDYSWLHRHIKHERLDDARAKLSYLCLFIDSNKPRFILDELSASPDAYLGTVLSEMGLAVAAFEAKDLKEAQKHFAFAALEMRGIVFP